MASVRADSSATASPRRPRDRSDQIARAAAGLFRDRGYHQVGVEEIAAAVGITGRAIYRHFDTKQALLTHVILDGLADVEAAGAEGTTLHEVVGRLAAAALDRRHLGVLVVRETRNMTPSDQAAAYRLVDTIAERVAGLLRTERPALGPDEAEFLARCALSVLASPSHHSVSLSGPGAERLLVSMAEATLGAPVRPGTAPEPHRGSVERASRREAVLAAAIELFGQRGFGAVRMEDIGAAAGITGPSVYEHFTGKADLLMAALTRGAEWLQLGLVGSLVPGEPPVTTLERVVRSYLTFAIDHRDLMRVFLREVMNLPDAERSALRRVQHQYVAEWVRLLAAARPELTDSEAWFVTHGGVAVINETVEADRRFDLVSVALAVLLGGGR